jgi:release factor glutamine methyltransferase
VSLSVVAWLLNARQQLSEPNERLQTDSPRVDAELILGHVLDKGRTWLFSHDDAVLSADQLSQANALLCRRLSGEPVAYLTGVRGFWTLDLQVAPSTLIPRPDTETLVEWALELDLPLTSRVLDLGTGTGAIALALASEQPCWQVTGVDVCADTVGLAIANARRNHLITQTCFVQSNWFEQISGTFDLIVSNPPYIDPADQHLQQGDVAYEPRSALVADDKGLADLLHIIRLAPDYLNADGWLLLEHGYDQAAAVCAALQQRGFVDVANRQDLGGNPRISGGRWPQQRIA